MTIFKQFEHDGWQSCFKKYNEEWTRLTAQTFPAILKFLENQQKPAGSPFDKLRTSRCSVLDVACGAGVLTNKLNELNYVATGIDFSAEMISEARLRYPDLKFAIGDAENLNFADESFDAVVMNFGILHLENPELAMAEAKRVLKPQGKFIFTAWTNPQESTGFGIILDAINKFGNLNVDLPKGPPFFRFGDPLEVERTLISAGFNKVDSTKVNMLWEFKNEQDFFDAFYFGTARTGALLRAQEKSDLKNIKEEIFKGLRDFKSDKLKVPMCSLVSGGE